MKPDTLISVQYWRKENVGSVLVEEFLYEQEIKIPREIHEGEYIRISHIKP